jgi:siroheme synthase
MYTIRKKETQNSWKPTADEIVTLVTVLTARILHKVFQLLINNDPLDIQPVLQVISGTTRNTEKMATKKHYRRILSSEM